MIEKETIKLILASLGGSLFGTGCALFFVTNPEDLKIGWKIFIIIIVIGLIFSAFSFY